MVELPPLRERREDIPLLVEHFVEVFNATQDKRVTGVSPEVLALLMAHDYPGNVRELQNVIEHAFVLCDEGQIELAAPARRAGAQLPSARPALHVAGGRGRSRGAGDPRSARPQRPQPPGRGA